MRCIIPISGQAQVLPLDSIAHKFDVFRKKVLHEKLYVHIDRSFYVTGELAWFKVYVTDASLHRPLGVSKVAYVEVLDAGNESVLQAKIALTNGTGNGSFFLPATLPSGNYRLRAYTSWMKNFSADLYFHQSITIVNPFTGGAPDVSTVTASNYTLGLFPEGGHLVAGVKSKVAFRIQQSTGNGIDLPGAILTDEGDTVLTFRPQHAGIGYFYFTPQTGKRYRAVLKNTGRNAVTASFPDIKDEGYAMHMADAGNDTLNIRVIKRGVQARSTSAYLFVHARQIIVSAETRAFKNDSVVFAVAKSDLPEGISHFTIFTDARQPVCERLYFTYPTQNIDLSAVTDQREYGVRRKVTVTLQAAEDGKHIPLPDVSVAVYKLDSLAIHPQQDIFSYLWLSSDLAETPDSIGYYFQKPTPAVVAAMDNLMLTHGWRRFRWNDVLAGNNAMSFVPEYRGHIIRGSVTNASGLSNTGILAYLSWPDKTVRLHSTRSDKEGALQFEVKDFTGRRRIVAQTNMQMDSMHRIEINDPFSNRFTTDRSLPFSLLPANLESSLQARMIAMQVNSIFHETTLQNFRKPESDTIAFYGKADETYMLDAYTRFPVMEEVMREYVPGVIVRKRRDGFHFLLLDDVSHNAFHDDPMILLDGIPVFDTDRIMAFNPVNVRKLEVMTRRYYLGPAVFSGIVSYTTYTGDLNGFELDPKAVVLDYEGLQQQREFYAPVYENTRQRNSRLADQRYLLHWTPTVTAQADGTAGLTFYTSDATGQYEICVEGLTADGNAVHARRTFFVKRFND